MKRLVCIFAIAGLVLGSLYAQASTAKPSPKPSAAPIASPKPALDLGLDPSDLRIELSNDGGYVLYVKKKPNIESVLLTESTEDPDHKLASYALRSKDANPINGEPIRKLDGEILSKNNLHFLLSSTVVTDKQFGQAFRIFIPYVVIYGYPWGRYGERAIQDGSYLSIRAFAKPFADYDGGFKDNPYRLKINQTIPVAAAEPANQAESQNSGFNKEAIRSFQEIAAATNGRLHYSQGGDDLAKSLNEVLAGIKSDAVDLVLCLDATEGMGKNSVFFRGKLLPLLQAFLAQHSGSRFAIIQYRDYMEEFLYKVTPFSNDLSIVQAAITKFKAEGGRDIPEAVNEALYASLTELDWAIKTRMVILIGDAPPHPIPRGTITADMVNKEAKRKNVVVEPIVISD